MDKSTLSNYGWIVIAVLVLSVMIALATPFGNYIKDAVWSATEGLFETEDAALGKVLDDMGIVPSVEELQAKHKFDYYSTFSGAVADVNANTIGENADCDKADATAGIYTDNGETFVVLLKDTTETSKVTATADITINLGGNVLNFDSDRGICNDIDSNNTINIDGRLNGSTIYSKERTVQCASGIFNINGGTYIVNSDAAEVRNIYFHTSTTGTVKNCTVTATSESAKVYGTFLGTSSTVTVENCTVTATSKNGNAYGTYFNTSSTGTVENCTVTATSKNGNAYGTYFGTSSTGTVKNCTVTATSESAKAYGTCFSTSTTGTVENCTVTAYSNYSSEEGTYSSSSSGIVNSGDILTLNDCYVMGTHSGVSSQGTLYVNGGTYEGYGHGGFYFGGTGTTSYVCDATIRQCAMPDVYVDKGPGTNNAGLYIGGNTGKDNITIYMDNCDIYGSRQPIVLRGTDGEQNNSIYISNSNINTSAKIRIDNDTHKLYLGKGNNFTVNDTTRPTSVIITDEIYCQ